MYVCMYVPGMYVCMFACMYVGVFTLPNVDQASVGKSSKRVCAIQSRVARYYTAFFLRYIEGISYCSNISDHMFDDRVWCYCL